MKLGVNIDHIATLRNARGQDNPNLIRALKVCQEAKIDTLTVHLREDRRHIQDQDLNDIKLVAQNLNLEMALTEEMLGICLQTKPNFCCIVPEKRNEITTEGGLNLNKISQAKLKKLLKISEKKNIQLSAFINPTKKMINLAKNLGFDTVELHTGNLDKKIIRKSTINQINEMIEYAHSKKLIVNVGHGLNFKNIKFIKKRKYVDTVHVGHFIISEAIFISLTKTINIFRNLIKK